MSTPLSRLADLERRFDGPIPQHLVDEALKPRPGDGFHACPACGILIEDGDTPDGCRDPDDAKGYFDADCWYCDSGRRPEEISPREALR